MAYPHRIMAQIINTGDFEDVCELTDALGDVVLHDIVRSTEAGEFDRRSWC